MTMVTGIVCVLDALGTKGVWQIDEPEKYLEKIEKIYNDLDRLKDYGQQQNEDILLDYITFSDTIIVTLHYKDYESESIIPPFARMIDGLYSLCLAENLFMRGAISYGKFIKKGNSIIGPAIDDAAYWHDKAQFIGCILTPSTSLLIEYGLDYWLRNPYSDYDYSQHTLLYDIPLKEAKSLHVHTINWPLSIARAWESNNVIQTPPEVIIKSYLGKYPIPPEAFPKHQNTIKFFQYSLEHRKD